VPGRRDQQVVLLRLGPGRCRQGCASRCRRALVERIKAVHAEDKTYGAPRITADLNDAKPDEDGVNHKRVARVMKNNGIAGMKLRRRVRTIVSEPSDQKVPDTSRRVRRLGFLICPAVARVVL
jgi:transposase InsO family protein